MSSNGPSRAFTLARPALLAYRLCTVNATTTVPFTLGFACTAAASAAHAARRPTTGAASSRSPYSCGRLASDTGASTAIPRLCTSAAEVAPTSTYALSTVKTGSGVPDATRPRVRCVDFTATTPGTALLAPNTVTR